MSFAENLRSIRRQRGISQNELAEKLGYRSFTTIQKWEDGTSRPPYRILEKLSELFGISVETLMSDQSVESVRTAPVLGTVRGGAPILAMQEVSGYEPVSANDPAGPEYFWLKVVGDSMKNDRILPGDLLYVHAQSTIDNGQIGVIMVDDEATVKRVYQKNGILTLMPSNPDYDPYVFTAEECEQHHVHVIGRVLSSRISF